MNKNISLAVPEDTLRRFARLARKIRRELNSETPTTEQLMVHALTDRASPERPWWRRRKTRSQTRRTDDEV